MKVLKVVANVQTCSLPRRHEHIGSGWGVYEILYEFSASTPWNNEHSLGVPDFVSILCMFEIRDRALRNNFRRAYFRYGGAKV